MSENHPRTLELCRQAANDKKVLALTDKIHDLVMESQLNNGETSTAVAMALHRCIESIQAQVNLELPASVYAAHDIIDTVLKLAVRGVVI